MLTNVKVQRNAQPSIMTQFIWEGVYKSFKETPGSGEGYNSRRWADKQFEKTAQLLDDVKKERTIPTAAAYRGSLLPLLAALVCERLGKVRILDFGGGLGSTFIPVAAGMAEPQRLEYHIVELEKICELGDRIFKHDKRITFHRSLPSQIRKVDIVHIASALQYVEDWKGLLEALALYQPESYMFTNLSAGSITTYATTQNY